MVKASFCGWIKYTFSQEYIGLYAKKILKEGSQISIEITEIKYFIHAFWWGGCQEKV